MLLGNGKHLCLAKRQVSSGSFDLLESHKGKILLTKVIVSCEGWSKRLCHKLQMLNISLQSRRLQACEYGRLTIRKVGKCNPWNNLVAPIIIWVWAPYITQPEEVNVIVHSRLVVSIGIDIK